MALTTDIPADTVNSLRFADDVAHELHRARSMWPPINSVHEGYAVILEELDEFWEEVKKKPSARGQGEMYMELVQIAAMAQRTALDCLFKPADK